MSYIVTEFWLCRAVLATFGARKQQDNNMSLHDQEALKSMFERKLKYERSITKIKITQADRVTENHLLYLLCPQRTAEGNRAIYLTLYYLRNYFEV